MLDSLDTATTTVLTSNPVVDTRLPPQGLIYPHTGAEVDRTSRFTVLAGTTAIITVYGLVKNDLSPEELLNRVYLVKLLESKGTPSSVLKGCTPCGDLRIKEQLSTILHEVVLTSYTMSRANPILVLQVPGRYVLELGKGVKNIEELAITLEFTATTHHDVKVYTL
jgi:hypothetical protein